MKVSICSSVLNKPQWLREMIESVRAQLFTDWELVLVDDGSTEDLKSVVDSFADERIRYFRFVENKGIPHGINFAFKQARGEYIQPLANDERLWPVKLGVQVKYLDEHPDKAAVFGLPREGDLGVRPEWEQYALKAHNRNKTQWLLTLLGLDNVPIGGCNGLWRKSLFDELGYFDETLTSFSDHEWYCRLVEKHDIHMMQARVAVSLPNPDAASVGNTPEKIAEARKQLAYVQEKHPIPNTDPARKVTIGIPVKDMKDWVTQAMKSVLAQTYQDFELLVCDDGSTDGTAEVVQKFIEETKDSRIKLHIFPENKGDREACKYMIAHAKGDFYVSLSADDLIEPDFLEKCVSIFSANPQLEFIASQTDFIDPEGKPFEADHPFKQIEKASNKNRDEWLQRLWYGNVYFGVGMVRTQALKDLGGWKQEYKCLADYEMYLALLQRGNIHVIEENLTHTRIHGKNMSGSVDQAWLFQTYAAIKKRFYAPRRKLIIATPFYNAQGFSPYIHSLFHTVQILTGMGLDVEYWNPTGDAYVQRVKNTIINKFLETDATDLLMIDSDMEWPATHIPHMLSCPEEIIVGSYPQKNSWDKWTSAPQFRIDEATGRNYAVERKLHGGGTLIEGKDLAGGFMLFKRAALEKFAEAHKEDYYYDPSADPAMPERKYIEFFHAGRIKMEGDDIPRFWGEDRTFSRKLAALGIRWWIYTDITFGHWGINRWAGNFRTALDAMKTGPAPEVLAAATQPVEMH